MTSIETRFWNKIQKSEACWLWTGACSDAGYGVLGKGKRGTGNIRATHVSWKIHNGSLPDKFVLHKCDNPKCVNPDHLFLGTAKDNSQDAKSKGRLKQPPIHRELNNVNGILTDEQVRQLRQDALAVPSRRLGRQAFWKLLASKYKIKPKYAQQLAYGIYRKGV